VAGDAWLTVLVSRYSVVSGISAIRSNNSHNGEEVLEIGPDELR
jgi:hypothetical protein